MSRPSLVELARRLTRRRFWLRTLPNVVHDLRRGGWLGGTGNARPRAPGAYRTQSTDYADLSVLLSPDELRARADDVAVDVGCGRGRVINWWLDHGVRGPIVGIELDAAIAQQTRRRLARAANVTILTGDAADLLPADGTLFYLYNPFDQRTMQRFEERLAALRNASGRLRVVYYNARHADVFLWSGRWTVTPIHAALPYPGVIIRPNPVATRSPRP